MTLSEFLTVAKFELEQFAANTNHGVSEQNKGGQDEGFTLVREHEDWWEEFFAWHDIIVLKKLIDRELLLPKGPVQ